MRRYVKAIRNFVVHFHFELMRDFFFLKLTMMQNTDYLIVASILSTLIGQNFIVTKSFLLSSGCFYLYI